MRGNAFIYLFICLFIKLVHEEAGGIYLEFLVTELCGC